VGSALRFLVMLAVAVALSLALLLLITSRNLGDMGRGEVEARWLIMVVNQAPVARKVQAWWDGHPPLWVKRLAVVWHRARPLNWWWLPLLFVVVQVLVVRASRRRMRRL